jgi:hypothetical protein
MHFQNLNEAQKIEKNFFVGNLFLIHFKNLSSKVNIFHFWCFGVRIATRLDFSYISKPKNSASVVCSNFQVFTVLNLSLVVVIFSNLVQNENICNRIWRLGILCYL